jgi:hypothetical protein
MDGQHRGELCVYNMMVWSHSCCNLVTQRVGWVMGHWNVDPRVDHAIQVLPSCWWWFRHVVLSGNAVFKCVYVDCSCDSTEIAL